MFRSLLFFFLAFSLLFNACITADQTYSSVAPGKWRALLDLTPIMHQPQSKKEVLTIHEQFAPGQLPFEFEVKYAANNQLQIEIFNGEERILVEDVSFGRSRKTARDTIRINFPEYQSYIIADVRGGMMNGHWVVTTKDDYRIPFSAKFGEPYRFTNVHTPPVSNLSGQWAALFDINSEVPDKAIGEFEQKGNQLLGTFRTETGDYRYLEGVVEGNKFWMSCFDGAHAFLFSGVIKGDSLQGEFRSGSHYQTLWSAWRDTSFKLAAPDSLAQTKDGGSGIKFQFATPDGQVIKYPSTTFDGKVKIFTISGTWCPNCKDEQLFLKEYLEQHPEQNDKISIVTCSFERYKDSVQVNQHLASYSRKLGISWPIVLAGKANKEEAQRVFPSLTKVVAFPTMIILDKRGKVNLVHTGFDGPATSKYADFKHEFETLMQRLIAE
jgi:thiol-disulfide isomerase/thioredoxin